MLKNIPANLPPELVKILMEMGHGDEVVLGDGNFPAASMGSRVIRCDGQNIPELLSAILEVFPLDTYSEHQVMLMEVVPGDPYKPEIWDEYKEILKQSGEPHAIEHLERFDFYDRARQAYAIIATGEKSLYANVILKKGVV